MVDPIIRDVQGKDEAHILAYADDLTPLGLSTDLLQRRIDGVAKLASSLGLSLNSAKGSSLYPSGGTPVGMRPTRFMVSGVPITALTTGPSDSSDPVGYRLVVATGSVISNAISQPRAIYSFMLAPWQRLDAVRTFVYPALNFTMWCGVLTKTDSRRLDDAVRPLVKRTL